MILAALASLLLWAGVYPQPLLRLIESVFSSWEFISISASRKRGCRFLVRKQRSGNEAMALGRAFVEYYPVTIFRPVLIR